MTPHRPHFVLTGGPGSGKTTLIAALAAAGYACAPEAGRAIIQAQAAIGGTALPWKDPAAFAELMLSWELRPHAIATGIDGPVFFDRGIPDVLGYLRLTGRQVPAHVRTAAQRFRYHPCAFIAPPWPEIYRRDGERRQDHDEAVRTHAAMVAAYADCGYRLVELPRLPVAGRLDFLLRRAGLPPAPATAWSQAWSGFGGYGPGVGGE